MQRPPLLLTSCMISGEHFAFLCLVFFICKMSLLTASCLGLMRELSGIYGQSAKHSTCPIVGA